MNQAYRLSAWYFWYFAFIGAFQPYFSLYLQAIGMSAERIAVLMSLGQLMRLGAPLCWSWLADRGGRRVRIMVVSTLAALGSFSAVFLTRDFFGLLIALAVVHFFWSASLPLAEALTLDHLAGRPERYGRIRLWGSAGYIATVTGTGWLLDVSPINALLWVSWALVFATFICSLSLTEVAAPVHHAIAAMDKAWRQPRVIFLLLSSLFMVAAHGALYVFYSIHLVAHGYDKTMVGLLWMLGVLVEILVFFYMPKLAVGASLRGILLACFALAALRFLLIGWAADVLWLLLLAQVLHGASFGAHHAAAMMALTHWFPPHQQSRAQALYGSAAYGLGGLLGALLAGVLWASGGAGVAFSAASALALIGLMLVWRGIPGGPLAHVQPQAVR
jgi:PPP family 3-phenylpropionic acid transporter